MSNVLYWMEEACTCGDVYSHPDGGDSQCRYCSGAAKTQESIDRMDLQLKRLKTAVGDAICALHDGGGWNHKGVAGDLEDAMANLNSSNGG